MKKYYFVSYVMNDQHGANRYYDYATDKHPFEYMKEIRERNKYGYSTYGLLGWKEISEDEYRLRIGEN